jgi:hypothetical protein
VQVRRSGRLEGAGGLAICSTPIVLGTLGGASLGVLMATQSAYPAQVVVSLATVGANIAGRRPSARPRPLGDALLLTVLLLLTGAIAGWNVFGAGGALAGSALGAAIAYARFRPATRRL